MSTELIFREIYTSRIRDAVVEILNSLLAVACTLIKSRSDFSSRL